MPQEPAEPDAIGVAPELLGMHPGHLFTPGAVPSRRWILVDGSGRLRAQLHPDQRRPAGRATKEDLRMKARFALPILAACAAARAGAVGPERRRGVPGVRVRAL